MGLRIEPAAFHTPAMTLKNAAVLALVGMMLLTMLLLVVFVRNLVAFMSDAIPAMVLLSSFVHAFASVSVALFFYAFQKTHS